MDLIDGNHFVVFLLSLGGAFFIGLNFVLTRKALDYGSRSQAVLVSLITTASIFWILLILFGNIEWLLYPTTWLFVFAGILGPGIGRTLNIVSLKKIGVSRTAPIIGLAPLFATLFAIIFLGEELSVFTIVSISFIVVGIYVLERVKGERFWSILKMGKNDLYIPLFAACFGGMYFVFIKWILTQVPDPLVGATLSISGAFGVLFFFALATNKAKNIKGPKKSFKFAFLGGVAMALGFLLNFQALKTGNVSFVAPILSTFPLFSVFLSVLIIKEKITKQLIIGAVIIVAGVMIINFR